MNNPRDGLAEAVRYLADTLRRNHVERMAHRAVERAEETVDTTETDPEFVALRTLKRTFALASELYDDPEEDGAA